MTNNQVLNQELVKYFYDFLSEKSHKTDSAINKIILDLKKFIERIEDTLISPDSIREYIFLLKDEYNPSTYKVKLSSLRQFCNWLDLKDNPFYYANEFEIIEDEEKENYYNEEEYHNLKKELSFIEKLIVTLIYELYLSVDDFYNLSLANFNFANLSFKIRETSIKLSNDLAKATKDFVRSLSQQGLEYKIFSLDPISNEEISLEKIFKRNNLSIKKLRRSRIVHLLNSGLSLDEVNSLLGLKLGASYEKFETQKKDYVLLKEFKSFHPRG